MRGGTRTPTWGERENNKRRERRRRAFAAKIFAGLRLYGNYKLPKHCDNNEVLKALCDEAGWTVEPDGTTYRRGCRPMDSMVGSGPVSVSVSPCSSYQPSPAASSFPSPVSFADGNSLIPWLRNLSSSSSSSKFIHNYMQGGSLSAPVTPPLSSPTTRTPRLKPNWDNSFGWAGPQHPVSTPPSPGRPFIPHSSKFYDGGQIPLSGPTSPTFSLVSPNPFGGLLMCTPGQSGTCSPAADPAFEGNTDIPMADVIANEFAFGSNGTGLVKPWEGERIHEECGPDELELTLGSSKTR